MDDDVKMAPVEIVRPRLTFADLERMPDDGRRYELYDGEVVVVPSPLLFHQILLARLTDWLRRYCADQGGLCAYAPLDIVFSDYDVLQPDIVYFSPERRPPWIRGR
jgi:Uma2 family endonuclease